MAGAAAEKLGRGDVSRWSDRDQLAWRTSPDLDMAGSATS
jgi:hypothetical protein